jgi:hypothetical protein
VSALAIKARTSFGTAVGEVSVGAAVHAKTIRAAPQLVSHLQRVMDLRLARASKLVLCVPRAVMVFFLLRFQLSFANDIQVLFQRVGTCADVKHFVLGQFEIRYDFIAVDSIRMFRSRP